MEIKGNWEDENPMDGMGFRKGTEAQIGGIVDMEDDVYLKFYEKEEINVEPAEPTKWKLLARYMASFKPNTNPMFKRFTYEVWHLRRGIRYSEKGINYYMVTPPRGNYDFVMRGGPWILNQNSLFVKDLDEAAQPSETILNLVPVWVRIYDMPWGKQDDVWGRRYGGAQQHGPAPQPTSQPATQQLSPTAAHIPIRQDNTEDEVVVFAFATVVARENATATASSTSRPPALTPTNAEEEPYKYEEQTLAPHFSSSRNYPETLTASSSSNPSIPTTPKLADELRRSALMSSSIW
ncbi:hypothetical protein QYE76_019898 [Lolium multiflorum]|uniref:DUF4283 domain-containing protein n=1 Tax=Lolium multiflorum TaxID=4521 RepID=A0AAD8R5C7_LOLMU|nr:hypothetical protein QYE76_019898 [Lolium multiflorum]